ncbi:MAG TPA: hypothetical protein PLM06_00770 [Anaerolineae bacterium]|nr:hypothetical protein [Anaerolineae bacterium]
MSKHLRLGIAILAIGLALATPTVALAYQHGPGLPPPPEWPVIGPILRWLGIIEETPAEMPAFDPTYTEHRLTTLQDAQSLWESLEPEARVRVIVGQEDANAALQTAVQNVPGLDDVTLTFESGSVTLAATVKRSVLERQGVQLPFFITSQEIKGELQIALGAAECRPTLTVQKVRLGKIGLPLRSLAEEAFNEQMQQEWMSQVCIERVFMLPGEFAVEGYRR